VPLPALGDFKLAKAGDGCPRCQGRLKSARGIEVGHIFKLGTKYSEAMNCSYLDANSQAQPVVMGCYGIGVSRMAAAWIEQSHDDKGIIWSPQIAPYHVHLIALNIEEESIRKEAETLHDRLEQGGVEVLFDDRPARAGEKFSDADLMGLPVRLTLSKRTQEQGKVEFRLRREKESALLTPDEAIQQIKAFCDLR